MNFKEEEKTVVNSSIEEDIKKVESIENQKDKKKTVLKYVTYLLLILVITGVVIYVNLSETAIIDGVEKKIYEIVPMFIANMDYKAFAIFLGAILLVFLVNSFILFLFAKLYQRHYKYHQACACQSIGLFYSAITPGASGGQFAQVVVLKSQGVLVSNGASIFVMSYIIYQSVLIFLGVLSVCTRIDQILSISSFPLDITVNGNPVMVPIVVFVILGFLLNVLVIALLIFMSVSHRFHNFVINHLIGFLAKLKIIKDPEKKKESIKIQVENFRIEFRRLQSNIPFTLLLIFLTLFVTCINDLFPLLAGNTLNGFMGLEDVNWALKAYDSIVLCNFHQMVTGLVPIPGSAGISEFVFERFFGAGSGFFSPDFYKTGGSQLVLLLWRFVTFYIPFFINGLVAALYKSRGKHAKDGVFIPPANKNTMLTLQLETYEERKESSDKAYNDKKELRDEKRNDRKEKIKEKFGKVADKKDKDKSE